MVPEEEAGRPTRPDGLSVPSFFLHQAGAIPVRERKDGPEVLLVTSVNKGRWIIPKGVIDPGFSAEETAESEAREEAGVSGRLHLPSVGRYRNLKWGGTCGADDSRDIRVVVRNQGSSMACEYYQLHARFFFDDTEACP